MRQQTRALHDQLEELVGLDRLTRSRADYGAALRRFLAVWHPLEKLLEESPLRDDPGLDLPRRLRSRALLADLARLGDPDPVGTAGAGLRAPWSSLDTPRAIGVLYVLEGSTLGGRLICRKLDEDLGITPGSGASFFAGHGPDNAAMWKSFLEWSETALAPGGVAEAVEAACTTFRFFLEAFRTS
ncbi:MAG: biliverdin-producing heme oxygenase [Akkermansiaceae bacterium]|nr:biliverdin-producing heme oxygenase [Akkermansiaceae bacterium]